MATVNLNPSSTVSNQWTINGGDGTVHGVLTDGSGTTSIRTANQSRTSIVELDDFNPSGYDNGINNVDGVSVTSIRHIIEGFVWATRGDDTDVQVIIDKGNGTTMYSENHNLTFNGYTPVTFNGTSRTTSDGSSAWAFGGLNLLRLNINTSPEDPPNISQANVTEAKVEVTYDTSKVAKILGVTHANVDKVNGV